MYKLRSAAIAALSLSTAAPAMAEFSFSGYTAQQASEVFLPGGVRISNVDSYNRIVGRYQTGELSFGAGYYFELDRDGFPGGASSWYRENDGTFLEVGYQNFLLSYGRMWGAGSIFPEDYFQLHDVTSTNGKVVRLDASFDNHRFAISKEIEDEDGLEIGYRGTFEQNLIGDAPITIRAGLEKDADQYAIGVSQKFEKWGYEAVVTNDYRGDPDDQEYGVTVFYPLSDTVVVSANYARNHEPEAEGIGFVISAALDDVRVKAEYRDDLNGDAKVIEVGLVWMFGKQTRADDNFLHVRDYTRGLGLYE